MAEDVNRPFIKKDKQTVNRHMKRCLISLIITEMQIKITMRHHLTLVWKAIFKMSTYNEYWRECEEKGILCHSWWECKLVQPLRKIVWQFLRKLKVELPYDPAIPLLGIYPDKPIIQKDTCTPIFLVALFTTAKTWNKLNVHWQMNG